jgi:CubicO group peptidase (beta-lactamase class C family)
VAPFSNSATPPGAQLDDAGLLHAIVGLREGIENGTQCVRDVSLCEDRCRVSRPRAARPPFARSPDELSPPPARFANWLPAPGEQPLAMTDAALPWPATRYVRPKPLPQLRSSTEDADETAPGAPRERRPEFLPFALRFKMLRVLNSPLLPAFAALLFTSLRMTAANDSTIPARLEAIVRDEMREWQIGGVAIALVDDQQVVFAGGFGEAKRDSVFRCGSISKLFNALAVMQQVEAGRLDLDAPLDRYGPGLLPLNRFSDAPSVTLRQLLCHRSGLQREAAVGGYFDPSQPGLAATVASVASGVLATRPGEKTRYSNFGASIAGHIVERVSGETFEDYQRAHIHAPLAMNDSAWTLARVARDRVLTSHMRVADGRGGWSRREAPLFDLGTIPAGNLFSTAEDLARFASALLAGGGGLVKSATLVEMWRPQLTNEPAAFGLGFLVGKFREHRAVSHSGAVYGHSTSLVLLPEAKVAVIVLANEDIVNGRVHRLSNAALSLMIEAKLGELPPLPPPLNQPAEEPAQFAGDYESQSYWARIELRDGQLAGEISGQPVKLTARGGFNFAADSRIDDATPIVFERDEAGKISGFSYGEKGSQKFRRVDAGAPPLPATWRSCLGSYGPDFIPLIVTERHGHLYAMTENMVDYRLTPLNRHACALPPGMYVDEQAVFLTNPDGSVHGVNFANMILPRR